MGFNFFRTISLGRYLKLHITNHGISFSRVDPNITAMSVENTFREVHENHSRGMYNEWLTPRIIKYAVAVILFLIGLFLMMAVVLPRYQARQRSAATNAPSAAGLATLQPAALKGALEQQQFSCTDAQQVISYYVWDCSLGAGDIQQHVTYYARNTNSVDYIEAKYTDATGALQADGIQPFFTTVVTAAYTGKQADEAKSWVNNNATTGNAQQRYEGVPFTISGDAQSRTLEIGKMIATK